MSFFFFFYRFLAPLMPEVLEMSWCPCISNGGTPLHLLGPTLTFSFRKRLAPAPFTRVQFRNPLGACLFCSGGSWSKSKSTVQYISKTHISRYGNTLQFLRLCARRSCAQKRAREQQRHRGGGRALPNLFFWCDEVFFNWCI